MAAVTCPLCGTRRARRGCPALGHQICGVCCGTKRLVQIQCPADCAWLAVAREHPPAVTVRQQRHDVGLLVQFMSDFSERQSQLFFLIGTFLVRQEPTDLQPVIDEDVAEAVGALASTFETASRGVIYEHRPASPQAERLMAGLKPVLAEAGRGAGSSFERDAASVLRRVEESVRKVRALAPDGRRAFLDLLGRLITNGPPAESDVARIPERSRLIVP
jgi:hypothetical protein